MADKLRGGSTVGGFLIWHRGNQGPDSGLDADTLDGLHASSFVQASTTKSNSLGGGSWIALYNSGTDIDHVWFEANSSTFHFVTAGAYKGLGNATIRAGAFNEGGTLLSAKYLGISAKAANSSKLDGYSQSTASTANTVVRRDSSGDIHARIFRSEYDSTNSTIGFIMTQVDTASNNYMRPSTPAQFRAAVTDGVYLPVGSKAADADKLDGINSSSFLRSDASDQKTSGTLRFNDNVYATFGTGDDVEHFFNATDYYTDIKAGNWYVRDTSTTRWTFSRTTGDFTATGNITAYSDRRLKEEITNIENAVDKVKKINGVTYTDIENKTRKTGVIAQEVLEVLPEAVMLHEETEMYSVAYGNMVGLLIEAIKEQQAQIDVLKAKL